MNNTDNWQTKKLGEIFQIERGGSPRPIQQYLTTGLDGINWIKIGDTKNITKYIYKTEQKIKPEGLKKSRLVNEGDFILSNSMSFGRPYIMKTQGAIHDGWLVLRKKMVDMDIDFFYYLLSSPFVFDQFDKLASGSTVRNLNTRLVSNVRVHFPFFSEQKRIVKILDEVFINIDKAKENTEESLQNSKKLFRSYLEKVFRTSKDKWECKKIAEIASVIAGQSPEGKFYNKDGKGTPFYQGKKDFGEKYIKKPTTWTTIVTKEAQKGDILMSVRAPVGPINYAVEKICIGRGLAAIRVRKDINREFLYYCLLSKEKEIVGNAGAVFRSINRANIEDINILLPSLSIQKDWVKRLDELSEQTKKLEENYKQKLLLLDELKKSVLAKAFSGQL